MRAVLFACLSVLVAVYAGYIVSQHPPSTLLSASGGLALFLAAFVRPQLGLYILIFSMLLSPEIMLSETEGKALSRGVTLRLEDFLLVVIGLSWLARNAVFKELGLFRKTPLNKPILIYALACALSTTVGVLSDRVDPLVGFLFVLKYVEYYIVFFMAVNYIEDMRQVKIFVFCMLLTCLITAVMGVLQIPGGGRVSAPFEGEIGEPNTFGGYLLLMGATAGGLAMTVRQTKMKLALAALVAVILIPFLYTESRSSYLAALPAILALGFMTEKKALALVVILAALGATLFYLPGKVTDRIFYTFTQKQEPGQIVIGDIRLDTSFSSRIRSWVQAIKDWPKKPALGYGVTGYRFMDAQFPRVLVETGLVGLFSFLFLLYWIFKTLAGNVVRLADPFALGLSRGVLAGYAGLLVHALGANTFIIVRIMEPFWFLMGMVVLLPELEE